MTEWRDTALVPCPTPCQPPQLCPFKGMESAGSGRGTGTASQSTEPLSSVQEALEAQWLLFKLDSWKAQAVGKGERALCSQRDSRHKRTEQNQRQGWRPCLLSAPSPMQVLGGLGREVCAMSPSGGARAASVLGPQSHSPTSVLGTGARPRPSSKDSSGSHGLVAHPRGSCSCTRKGGSRRSKLQEEEGWCGTLGIQTQPEVVILRTARTRLQEEASIPTVLSVTLSDGTEPEGTRQSQDFSV